MIHSRTLCVGGSRYPHQYALHELPSNFNILQWLSACDHKIKMYWHKPGQEEAAAVGSVLTLENAPVFQEDNDSPARFWGGHAFAKDFFPKDDVWDAFPKSIFFLPEIEISHSCGKITAMINSLTTSPIVPDFKQAAFKISPLSWKSKQSLPSEKSWALSIQKILKNIHNSHCEKIVLARRSKYIADETLNPFEMLVRLPEDGCTRFALQFEKGQTFIGATPESLYHRKKNHIFSVAIAGTRRRGDSEKEDLAFEKDLRESNKEQAEFYSVEKSILKTLQPLCTTLHSSSQTSVIKTRRLQHLYKQYEGHLREKVTDEILLQALHPTAAVGGFPKAPSLEYLSQEEPFERGWYSGPLGYVSQNEAEFIVAIRSALIKEKECFLFAGTGIVEGSIAEKEWEELEHKISHWNDI